MAAVLQLPVAQIECMAGSKMIKIMMVTDLDISVQVGSGDDEDRLPAKIQPPVETRRGPGGILGK